MEAQMGQSQEKVVKIDRGKTNSFRISSEFARETTEMKTNDAREKVRQEEGKEKQGGMDSLSPYLL